jgi:TonB family protein
VPVCRAEIVLGLLMATVLAGQTPVPTPTKFPRLSGGFGRPRTTPVPADQLEPDLLSFDTKGYDWREYTDEMIRRIKLHWNVAELARLGWKGRLTIRFYILADGRVADAKVIRYSGLPPFDNAALQAILKSSPFLPLPAELHEEREGVTVTFLYNMRIDTGSQAVTPPPRASIAPTVSPTEREVWLPATRPDTGARYGRVSLDEPDFRFPVYIQNLVQIISSNWYKPVQEVKTSPVAHFQIERDGRITNAIVVVSSGLPFVDRAALRAIRVSSPVPPLPAEFGGSHLGIQVVFE